MRTSGNRRMIGTTARGFMTSVFRASAAGACGWAVTFSLFIGCAKRQAAPPEASSEPSAEVPARPQGGSSPEAKAKPAPPPVGQDLARQLLESDGHGGWRKNEKAALELEKLTPAEIAEVWLLLKDEDAAVRRGASVFLLPLFDPLNHQHVEAFTAALEDSDRLVRARAIDAVRQFKKADQLAALPKLILLVDPQREDRPENRAAAARFCGSLKREAESAATALAKAAKNDPEARVRAAALAAVAQTATGPELVETLGQGLADSEASVRLVAASRLRQLRGTAQAAAPALAHALADADPDVADNAAQALVAIGAPSVEPLMQQLAASNPAARRLALAALAALGPAAKPAVPAIEACQQDADPQVRQLAQTALQRIKGTK